jgi:hypothetical protein
MVTNGPVSACSLFDELLVVAWQLFACAMTGWTFIYPD